MSAVNIARFLVFSFVEFISIYVLILSIFSFKIRYYIKEIVISSSVLASSSYLIIVTGNQHLAIFIQVLLMFATIKFIYKENALYSFVITILGYASYTALQLVLVYIMKSYDLVDFSQLEPFTLIGNVVQISTAIITIILSSTIRTVDGFAFSLSSREDQKRKISNKIVLNISVYALLQLIVFSYFYFLDKNLTSLISFLVAMLIALIAQFIIASLRNKEEYDKTL